jgi:hypothetical protein
MSSPDNRQAAQPAASGTEPRTPPPYQPPDIAWEEDSPPVFYTTTCVKTSGASQQCNASPRT